MIKSRDNMFDSFKADVKELFFQHQNEVKQLIDMQKNTTEQHSFETEVKELLFKHQNEVKQLLDEPKETREQHQTETELLKEIHQNINECPMNPCKNNAVCVSTPEAFFCKCLPGTSGALCEKDDIDDCANNPCGTTGQCIDKLYDHECLLCPIDDPKYFIIDGLCLYFEGTTMTFETAKANCETKFDGNGRLFEPRVYIIGFT